MLRRASRPPFAERGGKLRGALDVLTGRYPRFLFGGGIGSMLPVFHLHEVTPGFLEPRLRYLAENGYRTVTSDALVRFVRQGVHPGARAVVLCFDDAWTSLWTVAGPLLRRYRLQAITFAIPGRTRDAPVLRPTVDEGPVDPGQDRSTAPFATWPELRALQESGHVDVQSHSYSHARMFSADRIVGFVAPASPAGHPLEAPLVRGGPEPVFLSGHDLGAPLYPTRSRMADASRLLDAEARERCIERVRRGGGPAFFARPDWRRELEGVAALAPPALEAPEERERAVRDELEASRAALEARVGGPSVRVLCFPWGIGGALARRLAPETGYALAFSERLFGFRGVRAGDDPYRLMRLNGTYIYCLPGRARRIFVPGRSRHEAPPPGAEVGTHQRRGTN